MDIDMMIKKFAEESVKIKEKFFADNDNIEAIKKAASAIIESYGKGGKVLVFGNGGSAADSQHFAAELMVRFEKERRALPAVALTTDTSIITASGNDYEFKKIFSRQVEALAAENDIVVAISTSGNSENVIEGVLAAKKKGVPVVALTGHEGGTLATEADVTINVKAENTARIQEVHIAVIHILCKIIEDSLA
ncbi:MAG: D-sedoheptulose 7-phosphate isomerase [Candidatus Aadella gelida]|nr:D-sedoheptulose 7-phosphate isomerase [Candidatus Aadella gelida]